MFSPTEFPCHCWEYVPASGLREVRLDGPYMHYKGHYRVGIEVTWGSRLFRTKGDAIRHVLKSLGITIDDLILLKPVLEREAQDVQAN